MSRYIGGLISSDKITTSRFGVNSGMFTLGQITSLGAQGIFPSNYDVVQEFTGSNDWLCPEGVSNIESYLFVGGGGGGGGGNQPNSNAAGGGGAGAFKLGTDIAVVAGKRYNLSIGSGGVGGVGHPASTVDNVRGGNGFPTGLITEANVLYYVAVGAAQSPGSGNRFFVKSTNEYEGATANVEAGTLKLYEGSTYRFDQSHPSNSGHPFRFSSTVVSPASSATPYTTGVTTNQPSTGAGSPGSIVQIQVATPAPQLYYYCTSHPVSGSASMGGAADTIANVTTLANGGGGGGASARTPLTPIGTVPDESVYNNGHKGGSGGGSGGVSQVETGGGVLVPGEGNAGGINVLGGNYGAGGGGGAGSAGGSATPSQANGPNPQYNLDGATPGGLTGYGGFGLQGTPFTPRFLAGGGGGGSYNNTGVAPIAFGRGFHGGGDGAIHPNSDGATAGTANTGGGGGGSSRGGTGATGGSGILFIKYKNSELNKNYIFNGSGVWKNDFGAKQIDYLVVGAGGGGGEGRGGGGGAGGYIEGSGLSIDSGQIATIVVGAGGAAGLQGAPGSNPFVYGQVGGNSTFITGDTSVDAHGGGGGGNTTTDNPRARRGGSGAGGCNSGAGGVSTQPSPGLGNAGGGSVNSGPSASGGGGGALVAGFAGVTPDVNALNCSRGGNGKISEITGSSKYYAGGGGGSCDMTALETAYPSGLPTSPVYNNFATGGLGGGGNGGANRYPGVIADAALAENGVSNTGGGGGGGQGAGASSASDGGSGGSGIVVIKITG